MTEIPRYWRLREELLRLEGSNCPNCKIKHFPPREICPDCGFKTKLEKTQTTKEKSKESLVRI